MKTLAAIGIGSLLGVIGSRYLFVGSWLSLIPWGIIGLALGAWNSRRGSMLNGAVYGFCLAFVFMLAGYAGAAPWFTRIPFFAVLGLVGAVCGFVLGILGYWLKLGFNKPRKKNLA